MPNERPEAVVAFPGIGRPPRTAQRSDRPLLSMLVTRRSNMLSSPRDYLAEDESWPSGTLIDNIPGEVLIVQRITQMIWDEINKDRDPDNETDKGQKITVAKIADQSGVALQTVYNFLNGESWGTIRLLYGLERALGETLWTKDHLSPRWDVMLQRRRRS